MESCQDRDAANAIGIHRDDRVVAPRLELFERDLPEERACRSARVDTENLVAQLGERGRDAALLAAPDLEHPRRSRRKL